MAESLYQGKNQELPNEEIMFYAEKLYRVGKTLIPVETSMSLK